jgi:CDP-diacylglycerol--serine O-phosphatidyltransferase
MVFPPIDSDRLAARKKRFRAIPVRVLLPNLITLLSLCAGLTAIRLAIEGRLEWALGAIVFAAILDGVDGRLARMLKGQSRFGAELDSLADFVNFGVVPGLILYFWGLNQLGSVGWIASLVFAICMVLRLARFNVMADDPTKPAWAGNFFTGVPAPAGAIIVMLPIYLSLLGVQRLTVAALIYTLVVSFLLVSTLPVFSGKQFGKRVPPDRVLPIFVVVVLFVALLVSYPWWVLTIGTVCYLASLPFGWLAYQRYKAQDAVAAGAGAGVSAAGQAGSPPMSPVLPGDDSERPERLN